MCMCAAVAASVAGPARGEGLIAPPMTLDPTVATLADANDAPKSWMDQVKNPFTGFTWGADLRLRFEGYNNAITMNQQATGHEVTFFRYRPRIFGTYTANENLAFNARLQWEGRHYQNPNPPTEEWYDGQGYFDIANAKITVPQLATTLLAGRQEIILGDGWLVREGTPLDGSTTFFFDAIRSTTELKELKTNVDLIYIQQYSSPKRTLPTLGDTDLPLIENNERGAILYVTNKSIENVEISPYFIYKHDKAITPTGSDNADIYTVGARVVDSFTENLSGKIEGAYQFGVKNGDRLSAWGLNSNLAYAFKDSMSNELRMNFEYLSGNNAGSSQNEEFDPLWGRWPQWSELYVYSVKGESRGSNITNLIRVGPEYAVKVIPELELNLRYNALFANSNGVAATDAMVNPEGYFRGQLLSAILRYKMNKNLSAHLWAEYLIPGNFYRDANRDNAVFFRAELFLTF
jgi:hypothetical protein